jgi:hypothetical protein
MEGPARRNSGKLSSNQPVFRFSRKGWRAKRFQPKWVPVRVKKTRQNKNLEPRSDEIGTE